MFTSAADDVCGQSAAGGDENKPFEALLIEPDAVDAEDVARWKREGFSSLVIVLDERFDVGVYQMAVDAIEAGSLDIYYWIEVG